MPEFDPGVFKRCTGFEAEDALNAGREVVIELLKEHPNLHNLPALLYETAAGKKITEAILATETNGEAGNETPDWAYRNLGVSALADRQFKAGLTVLRAKTADS